MYHYSYIPAERDHLRERQLEPPVGAQRTQLPHTSKLEDGHAAPQRRGLPSRTRAPARAAWACTFSYSCSANSLRPCIVMALYSYGIYSYGMYGYGTFPYSCSASSSRSSATSSSLVALWCSAK